jgi:outer membrane protein TolC
LALLCLPWTGLASTGPLSLAEAERRALAQEPGQQSLSTRSVALAAEAAAAGSLPPPQVRVGLNNYPIERGDFSTEGMTSAGLTWRQVFPPGDVRALKRARLDWESSAVRHAAETRQEEIRLQVRQDWLTLYLGQQSEKLLEETRPLFRDLLDVTRSLYAVGRKSQQDVLRAELELGRLEEQVIEARAQQQQARASLAPWIGDLAELPLPETLPELPTVATLGSLERGLESHPRLRASDAQLAARAADIDLATEQRKPGWALDLGYAYRDGELPDGRPRSDFVTVGVTVDLPFLRRSALDSQLTAALETRNAGEWQREALRRELERLLRVTHARWTELGQRLALYERGILAQAGATAQAAKVAYQSDTADFADVMRAAIDELDARLEYLRLRVEQARSQAVLAYLGVHDHDA